MQVTFREKLLLGNKTERDDSPQTRSTKYSENSSDLPFECTPTALNAAFGAQDNVFKTGTKRLCTVYSIIKTLRLSGKNPE